MWCLPAGLAGHVVTGGEIERRERRGRVGSGVAAIDALIGGGWPRGALSELAGGRSSGRTAVSLQTLGAALRRGETVALVDVDGNLDPRVAAAGGMPIAGLLWVKCGAGQALAAAEIVVAAGGFAVVTVDLGAARLKAPTAAWQRLKRAAEQQGTVVLVTAAHRLPGALGACAVTLAPGRPRWQGAPASGPQRQEVLPSSPLLLGLASRASVERGGAAAADVDLTFGRGAEVADIAIPEVAPAKRSATR
jgi:protein ImuA